jgi:hypothetical protein
MSKLLITTQVYENYGAHDWDGTGECPQYWKAKGGSDYVVLNIDINRAAEIFEAVRAQCECDNEGYREHALGWEVVADDYLTEFEQSQLDYEGKIRFPATTLTLETTLCQA